MPIKCHFCENNTHPYNDVLCERFFITVDEAISLLDYSADDVHVFIANGMGMLIGCDWQIPEIINLLENAKHIEIAGGVARSMKHAICVHINNDDQENRFLASNEDKLIAFEEIHRVK